MNNKYIPRYSQDPEMKLPSSPKTSPRRKLLKRTEENPVIEKTITIIK
ncbi:MAG: hypothetical protein MK127_02410 [Dehalococcoidia bacterium]|nr:hypothetical protein [Dehalococcoidia bacterium]